MRYLERLDKIQAVLRRKKLDALLVSQPHNTRYLRCYAAVDHGIAERSGVLLIPTKGQPLLLTDFRFKLQAEVAPPLLPVVLYPKGLLALLNDLLPDLKIRSLGFESDYTLFSVAGKLKTLADKIGIQLFPTTGLVEKLRLIKDEEEIEKLRTAVALNEQVFSRIYNSLEAGRTERDIALDIEMTMQRLGAEAPSFDSIVASGPNSALPHAVPGSVMIERGQPLMIDMGLILDGYCSDMTRTFVLGEPDDRYLSIHRLVRRAQLAALAAIRAGVTAASVDKVARDIITDAGYGPAFGHSLGHGVGLAVHEEPRLSARNTRKLQAEMVVTVEPGIYIPGWGGVRLENMVVVRADGCELLNKNSTWLDL